MSSWRCFPSLGISTPSLSAQGEQRRSTYFNIGRDIPLLFAVARHFKPAEADKAFRLFVSWSVRFLIFGGRGGMLDSQYSLRAKEVGTGEITTAEQLKKKMDQYVPIDREFEEAFAVAR